MQSHATVAVAAQNPVAAIFDLDDPAERRIFNCIQIYYTDRDRLHAMRRGVVQGPGGPIRMVWTLGSFTSARRGAPVEWSVAHFCIDTIAVSFRDCPDETTARKAYKTTGHPDARLPGMKMKRV